MNTNKQTFPLDWPLGYKRTASYHRKRSKFKTTPDKAQNFLRDEIQRLVGRYTSPKLVVSTNIPVRNDGGLYSAYMNKQMDDSGVAIYFIYKNKDVCMCCDQYITVWENVYALAKGIEALRGMDRWGVSDFLDRAFSGFTAIEAPKNEDWWNVLEIMESSPIDVIKINYRRLCKEWHPDVKGNAGEEMIRKLNNAYDKAKQVRNFV